MGRWRFLPRLAFSFPLVVENLPSRLFPFQQVDQLALIEPYAVMVAAVDDDAATVPEVSAGHEIPADRAFPVYDCPIGPVTVLNDIVDELAVYLMIIGNTVLENVLHLTGVEEQAEAGVTALDIEFAADLQVDGLHRLLAVRAMPVRLRFHQVETEPPVQIDVIAYTAVFAVLIVCPQWG